MTNTGDKAGKDVVEAYYNPPYTDGGIEKASKNLAALREDQGSCEPGESQKVTVKFDDDDMASYDYKGAKAYVLEQGDYDISIQSDSHHVIDHRGDHREGHRHLRFRFEHPQWRQDRGRRTSSMMWRAT